MVQFDQIRRFDGRALVPSIWRGRIGPGIPYVSNPSIIAHGAGAILASRIVLEDGEHHIAVCRLDQDLVPDPSSIVAFTHHLRYADDAAGARASNWAADPRLTWIGQRLFMNFNTGNTPVPNRIYLSEIDPNTLMPLGMAREVQRVGPRRTIEKNWMFFSHGETVYVIYQFAPLEILKADLSQPDRVLCVPAFRHQWNAWPYEQAYGELRGSASPILREGQFYALAHSVCYVEARRPRPVGRPMRYVAAMLTMRAAPPFAPIAVSSEPLAMLNPAERALPLRPPEVSRVEDSLYACGAMEHRGHLLISYGISNQYAAVRRIDWNQVETNMLPVIHSKASVAGPSAGTLRASWRRRSPAMPFGTQDNTTLHRQNQFVHGNFGDMTAPLVLQRLTGLPIRNTEDGVKLLTTGSLLHAARNGDVVWGSGLNGRHADRFQVPTSLRVHATLGPISLDFLRRHGVDVGRVNVFVDPAALIPHLYAREIAAIRQKTIAETQDVLIIPHFNDDTVMRKLYPAYRDRIAAADTPVFAMIARILRAGLVVSSALHGIVLAEALGVPAIWHRPLMGEDELKYHDYYLGTGRYNIIRVETLQDAFKASAMPLPAFDTQAFLASFPTLDELTGYGLIAENLAVRNGRLVSFTEHLPGGLDASFGWSSPEPHGRWNDGDRAELAIEVGDDFQDGLCCELLVAPYLPLEDSVQSVTVSDATSESVSWALDRQGDTLVRFPLRPAAVAQGRIVLTFQFPNAVSPISLGLADDSRLLAVTLKELRVCPLMLKESIPAKTPEAT